MNNNIIILSSDKDDGVVVMDSIVYNLKLMDLLDDSNTSEQIYTQTISKNMNNFNKSYKKLVSNEDKFLSSLINYHPTIPKIYGLPKIHKPDIPLRPIISCMGSAHDNIVKLLAKTLSPLLGIISNAHINKSGSLLNKLININKKNKYLISLDIKSYILIYRLINVLNF